MTSRNIYGNLKIQKYAKFTEEYLSWFALAI